MRQVVDLTDLEQLSTLELNQYDYVFHLACDNNNFKTDTSIKSLLDINIVGTYTLLEALVKNQFPGKYFFFSSFETIFNAHHKGWHPYDVSKASAQWIVNAYREFGPIKGYTLLLDNVYGGRDFNWNRLVPYLFKTLHHQDPIVLRTDGKMKRRYLYIQDIIEVIWTLATQEIPLSDKPIGIFAKEAIVVRDLVEKIISLYPSATSSIQVNPTFTRQESAERSIPDSLPIYTLLPHWQPRYSLELGLNETKNGYEAFFRAAL